MNLVLTILSLLNNVRAINVLIFLVESACPEQIVQNLVMLTLGEMNFVHHEMINVVAASWNPLDNQLSQPCPQLWSQLGLQPKIQQENLSSSSQEQRGQPGLPSTEHLQENQLSIQHQNQLYPQDHQLSQHNLQPHVQLKHQKLFHVSHLIKIVLKSKDSADNYQMNVHQLWSRIKVFVVQVKLVSAASQQVSILK